MGDAGGTELRTDVRGIDNRGATEDDGTPVRPDLVISVQPTNENNRAQLPVSTLDWSTNTRGQFIPVHGLDFLIGVSSLLIQQTVELTDLTSKIESENRYIVRVPNGEALYIASETSSSTQRCLCGPGRGFRMHLHDNTRQEAMVFTRRLAAASCCFPCRLQEMQVVTPPGDYVGRVQQQCTWMVPFFLVRDVNDQVLFVVEGPAVMQKSALLLSEFKIMTGDSLRVVGKIAHGWDRELNSFTTTIQVPAPAVQPKHKALILAAAFLLSLEWYTGNMFHDTMHGDGEYRWRYLGADHLDTTYEGWFYNNSMHGYGLMSYPDGRVFNGLYYKNFRWGPGVESDTCLRENVGLWYGYQLIRLAWRPTVPSVAIDFVLNPLGVNLVARHRILLKTNLKTIGEVNSAIELLKQSGCEPLTAAEKWPKLYAKNCTDLSSQMCHVQAFDRAYYKNGINTLTEATQGPGKDSSQTDNQNDTDRTIYYAWSNNKTIIQMMKHCFTHEEQRGKQQLNIADILSGIRNSFKKPAKHEMDCRSLIMASYLGLISNVATLINECDVNPNVTDVQGNSSVMYAACGDQLDTINFLVEAGAEIDAFNDACCTPLAITLLRYVLEKRGVACNAMLQALLPPPSSPQQPPMPDGNILEWQINRESRETANHLLKQPSKFKVNVVKSKSSFGKMRKTMSKIDYTKPADKKKTAITEPLAQDKQLYETINTQYLIRVAEAFSEPSDVTTIPYIFEVSDMCKDGEAHFEEEAKKVPEKTSKKLIPVKSGLNKPSRDEMFQEKEEKSEEFLDPWKQENLARIMLTILQLLSQGANPRKVRCPQPALFIAAVSGSAELIQHLVRHGADVNEVYPEVFGYSTLDVAVSGPLTNDNLEVIHELLQSGANPDHRLKMPERPDTMSEVEVLGPTLLHVVLTRKIKDGDTHNTADVRNRLLELLLQYGCNPITQFKGQSAVDMALNRGLEFFDIFLRCPRTDLNAVINDSNQTILVKMFCFPFCSTLRLSVRLQMLTNLLLFGADPLIKCRNGQDEYGNLFVFAKSVLSIKQAPSTVKATNAAAKGSKAPKKPEKKNEVKPKKALDAVSRMKTTEDSPGDYRQALDLVVECARLLYIRWLQAQLMKELIEVVNKYKQRHWTMILKEHNNKKCISLWLNVNRGLEIWDTLKTTKKKKYDDEKILKQVLCIIHFYFMRTRILRYPSDTKTWYSTRISFQEKEFIENYVESCKREHTMSDPILMPLTRQYVTPELTVKEVEKFNVCFDCIMPLEAEKILCDSCKLVSFCSFDCMETNINRINCHPCSNYLQEKYFPTPEE